jgi:hypothetical protein
MNLADYLSELLGQYEEVSVPGLGYFVRERVNGYYNDKEARFYPPQHKVKFVPNPKDDDIFAQYVADKKNISLASSKYFAEKFVSKLKEQALTGKYLFADLGLFYTEQDQLVFKPNDKITDDPAFYGYPQLNIYKQGQPLNEQNSRPSFANTVPAAAPRPVQPVIDEPYFEDEAERKKGLSVWMIVLIAVTAIALAVFGIFKFYPEAYYKVGAAFNRITGKADTVAPVYRHEIKADTIKKAVPAKDTTIKTTPPAVTQVATVDTIKHASWVILIKTFRQEKFANEEVNHLKAKGVDAKILTKEEAAGPRIKVSVGNYPTQGEAEAAKIVLINAGKIPKDSYSLQLKN